jgi:hypothetical protein
MRAECPCDSAPLRIGGDYNVAAVTQTSSLSRLAECPHDKTGKMPVLQPAAETAAATTQSSNPPIHYQISIEEM